MKLQKGEVVVVEQEDDNHYGSSELAGVWVVEANYDGPEQLVEQLEGKGVLRRISAHHVHLPDSALPGSWQYITAVVPENKGLSEEEWCLELCKRAGIAVSSGLGSEAALQVERRFPTRSWKESVAAGSTKTYRQWVLAQIERSGVKSHGV